MISGIGQGVDESYGNVLYWKYYHKKDIIDITIDNDASGKRLPGGKLEDHGMRGLKYHCRECQLIFGYEYGPDYSPVDCPGCGCLDAMLPGKPGILVTKLHP